LKNLQDYNSGVIYGESTEQEGLQPALSSLQKPSVSLILRLCYPSAYKFKSVSTIWGCEHESDAVEEFLDSFAMDHQDVKFKESGLVVNKEYPFLGATPDGIIQCSCHSTSLLEVKCPYRCCGKPLADVVQETSDFYLKKGEDNSLSLDKTHSYYYQVQCQLNVCMVDLCHFVIWAPDMVHIEEIHKDSQFFDECLKSVDKLLVWAVLPEVIGCYFSKPRRVPCDDVASASALEEGEKTYCYCNGMDDGSKMILCENEDCMSGQWFHLKCLNMKRAPKGSWYCNECQKKATK